MEEEENSDAQEMDEDEEGDEVDEDEEEKEPQLPQVNGRPNRRKSKGDTGLMELDC